MSAQQDEDRAKESSRRPAGAANGFSLSGDEQGEVEEKRQPRAAVLHEVIRREGEQELSRGFAALSLISPVARAEPGDPTVLSALAAALAETGRLPEAAAEATKALEAARAAGDQTALPMLQQRLDTYRSGKAWRQ